MQLVLFNPLIGPYQVLLLQVRVDLGVLAVKGHSTFPKSSSITGTLPSDCLVSYTGLSPGKGSYLSAEVQSVYSTAQADWAKIIRVLLINSYFRTCPRIDLYKYIYPNPLPLEGCDTILIFKWCTVDLKSKLSISYTGFPTKAKNSSLSYLPWIENSWIHTFPKGISSMWIGNNLV